MATYGYARVSTTDQDRSLEIQQSKIEAYVAANPDKCQDYKDTYFDDGVSGERPFRERPMGCLLNAMLRRGDTVVVSNFDRLFRRASDTELCIDQWKNNGVALIVLDMPIDTTNPVGAMVAEIVGSVKRLERRTINERIRTGILARKAKFDIIKPPKGWCHLGKNNFAIDHEERAKDAAMLKAVLPIFRDSRWRGSAMRAHMEIKRGITEGIFERAIFATGNTRSGDGMMAINTITQRAVMAVLDWPFIHWREAIKLWNPFIPYQHMAKEPTTATVVAYEEFKHLFRPTPLEVTLDKLEQLAGIRGEPFVRGDYGI